MILVVVGSKAFWRFYRVRKRVENCEQCGKAGGAKRNMGVVRKYCGWVRGWESFVGVALPAGTWLDPDFAPSLVVVVGLARGT